MTIDFKCPHCEHKIRAAAKIGGQNKSCPKCGKPVLVPLNSHMKPPAVEFDVDMAVEEASAMPAPPPKPFIPGKPPAPTPDYASMKMAGNIIEIIGMVSVVLGIICLVLAAITMTTSGQSPTQMIALGATGFGGVINGIFMIAAGEALHALRDIARNSFG